MAGFGVFSAPDFVEREPWERGFAQIFARDIAPRLVWLERQRWLLIAVVCLLVVVTAAAAGLFAEAMTTLPKSPAGKAYNVAAGLVAAAGVVGGWLIARWFRQHEERLFLAAVCRQFDGVTVQVAPKGATVSALDPYWDLDLIPRLKKGYHPKLEVRELFTAEHRGVALSLVAIDLFAMLGRSLEHLFRGDLVELTLPDPAPGSEYPAGRFDAGHLGDAGMSAGLHDLRTPRVAQAFAELCPAFWAPQALGALSGNRLHLAVPFSKQAQRASRFGLWRRVYRCEPAIRAALAQLNAVLRLTDAVAEACAQPAAGSAWAGVPPPFPAPAAPLPQEGLTGRPAGWGFLAVGVGIAGIILLAAFYTQHRQVSQIRQAAEAGDSAAQTRLGQMYLYGRGIDRDYAAAMQWFQKAADQGDATAQNDIGWVYQHGLGAAQDYGEAMRWYRESADQGDEAAQNNIGNLYWNGSGVAQDYDEAMRWYRKAADQGNAWAQVNLGWGYQNGQGAAQDYVEAMRWYRNAAGHGNARAQYHIGTMYANGWGVPADPDEARNWMQQAAAKGEQDAKKWLAAQ